MSVNWAQLYAELSAQLKAGGDLTFWQDFFVSFYKAFIDGNRWQLYLRGVGSTLKVTVLALLMGLLLRGGNGNMTETIIWIAAVIIFGVTEAVTAGLVSIWFVLGAVAGLITAVLGGSIWLQVVLFFIVSIATLVATRPLVRKLSKKGQVATNADRVLGGTARVTETIDNTIPTGEVYIDGKTWTARSQSGAVIAAETLVTVIRMEGVKLYVDVPHDL